MADRFELEQQIMGCWSVVEDVKLLHTTVLEGKPGGGELTSDEISNYLMGLESIYQLKFEQLSNTFTQLVEQKKIQ